MIIRALGTNADLPRAPFAAGELPESLHLLLGSMPIVADRGGLATEPREAQEADLGEVSAAARADSPCGDSA